MNKIEDIILKSLRKICTRCFPFSYEYGEVKSADVNKTSALIYQYLVSGEPCMIGRFGAFELATVTNYVGVINNYSLFKYIMGKQPQWWWNENLIPHMKDNAGFYPLTEENLCQFGELMLKDSIELDVLGSWLDTEYYIRGYIGNVERVVLHHLEPFWAEKPWTRALRGKKVLVVHPFANLIEKQYNENRDKLFPDPEILPEFELQTIEAVQSIGGSSNGFKNWFEALQFMKDQIDQCDYDICLIGCGAYGFPLAAHVKRQGKKAIHLGGALQLLFGIKGKRWEDVHYFAPGENLRYDGDYRKLINEFWVRPEGDLMPKTAQKVEGGCYW